MKIEPFRKIVSTVVYETKPLSGFDKRNPTKYRWENTNKLLGKMDGIIGTKTGITNAAGPCFAGYYELNNMKLALILCHSKTMDDRWQEIRNMVKWAEIEKAKSKQQCAREKARAQVVKQN